MKTVYIGSGLSIGSPPSDTTDEWFHLKLAAYEECLFFKRCFDSGITFSQVESSDISSAETVMESMSTELQSWLTSAVDAYESGQEIPALSEDYIPELIEFIALAITGQWGLIFVLFVKVGLKFLTSWLRRKLNPDTEISESAALVSEIFLDKTDPNDVKNRLEELIERLETLSPIVSVSRSFEDDIDSADWERMESYT